MSKELVPNSLDQLFHSWNLTEDKGSFLVTESMILDLSFDDLLGLSHLVDYLVVANPDYEFVVENKFDGSVLIKWRKLKVKDH